MNDFDEIDALLHEIDAEFGAAESHGVLCGLLCTGAGAPIDEWMRCITGTEGESAPLDSNCKDTLTRLYQDAAVQLADPDYPFQPFLPADDTPLPHRARTLGLWCQGFLYGLGVGGIDQGDLKNDDVRELIDDLREIALVQFEMDAPGEPDERAYAEIVEYVRAAVLNLLQELGAPVGQSMH